MASWGRRRLRNTPRPRDTRPAVLTPWPPLRSGEGGRVVRSAEVQRAPRSVDIPDEAHAPHQLPHAYQAVHELGTRRVLRQPAAHLGGLVRRRPSRDVAGNTRSVALLVHTVSSPL